MIPRHQAAAPLAADSPVHLRLLQRLEERRDLDGAVLLLRDAFDMLEEDYEEERFFAAVRKAYWEAGEGSATRRVADALIQKLEL